MIIFERNQQNRMKHSKAMLKDILFGCSRKLQFLDCASVVGGL